MNCADIRLHYTRLYRDLCFERHGLFDSVRRKFNPRRVVYVGSSIHVTPSFHFSDVTYVDDSELAQSFFSDKPSLISFVGEHKRYRGRTRIDYRNIDYLKHQIAPAGTFDLAFSIFAPRSLGPASACVKKNGIIVSLPLPSVKHPESVRRGLIRLGSIVFAGKRYRFVPAAGRAVPRPKVTLRYITGNRFVEKNSYSVFRKL